MPGRIIMDTQTGMDPNDVKETRPPELDGSWREGEQNKSMGVMMDRLAQQAFFDLNDTINKMAETGRSGEYQQTNGVLPNTLDTSDESLQRKRLILDFAKEQRDRFTKALVLSDWSRNGTDMARLIDIKVWQDKQRFAHANAKHAVGQIKVDTIGARMPNPNIEGAMEFMATGNATWVPDLGYIQPKRLSPSQLLRTLREMNVVLAVRLNLHEKLPHYMREFSIANGRATFTVPGEFEVDLAVADEESGSPFYFIDLRFLFSPAPASLGERLRGFLEGRVNQAIASFGLQGCYDVLHNFTLTHKINVLKDQAQGLARGDWFDCIKIESLRRNLVVQYWCNKPGPKSWIEIGIASKSPTGSKRSPANPSLVIRCFQRQAQVNLDINFDFDRLDLEAYLFQIISTHSGNVLMNLHSRLSQQKKDSSAMTFTLQKEQEGANASDRVIIRLERMRTALCCQIEAITGQFVMSPSTTGTANVERMLNQDAPDPAALLIKLMSGLMLEDIAQAANLLGWSNVHGMSKIDTRAIFGLDVRQRSFYSCSPAWGSAWALAVTIGLDGTKWWIVRIATTQDGKTNISSKTILSHQQLKTLDTSGKQVQLDADELLSIEKLAVAQVSFSILAQDLATPTTSILKEVPDLTLQSITDGQESYSTSVAIPAFFRFARLAGRDAWKTWRVWAEDIVRLTHLGFDDGKRRDDESAGFVRHEMLMKLKKGKMTHLRRHLSQRPAQEIAFNEHGMFAIELHTRFGEPILSHIRDKLSTIKQLDERVSTLQSLGCQCTSVTLRRLCFQYSKDSQFAAQIDFGVHDGSSARLKFEPDTNPHLRIRVLLEQLLNAGPGGAPFTIWVRLLQNTLPLLSTLSRVESPPGIQRPVSVRIRNVSRYSLQFGAPHPRLTVNISLRIKSEGVKKVTVWQLEDGTTPAAAESFPEDFKRALSTVWQEKTDLWFGTGKGLIAFPAGVSGAIEKLVNVVKRFEEPRGVETMPPTAAPLTNGFHKEKPQAMKTDSATTPFKAPPAQMRKQAGTRQDAITLD